MSVATQAAPVTTATVKPVSEAVMRSYGRCSINPKFFDSFYARFTAKSPVIRQMFANTDMAKQKLALRSGISFLLQYANGSNFAATKVAQLGESHKRDRLNVAPSMYPMWLDALMETVAECDDQFTPETRAAWLAALRKGVEKMSSMY